MPEIWIPYGEVEALITVQAENLGTVVDPEAEKSTGETDRLTEKVRRSARLFVCDLSPTTIQLLKEFTATIAATAALKVHAGNPRRLESLVPDLKGRVTIPTAASAGGQPYSEELLAGEEKFFLGTARPDPLFGIIDTKVAACLSWVAGSRAEAAQARKDFEPTPFERTDSYEKMEELASRIQGATFLTVIPRSGRVRSALEDAPFDAIRNGFYDECLSQAKAIIVGAGGRGYDDTLSGALRTVWGSLNGVRKSGEVLLFAECSAGLGSKALEMLVTGRIGGGAKGREKYLDGLEEVYYLNKMKDEYNILLLSGLPELYAKTKLGFTTAKGSGEALGRLLNRLGKTAKVNVVTRASECRISSA